MKFLVYGQVVINLVKFAQENDEFKIKLLEKMDKIFFNNMEAPLILSDFITVRLFLIKILREFLKAELNSSTNFDIKILALKAIFILIVNHSFEYCNYYLKLYSLLKDDVQIYQSKYLFKFLSLLEVSLRTSKISAKAIAAFIKVSHLQTP